MSQTSIPNPQQRNAQKLYNYLFLANQFRHIKDIYFYLKYCISIKINDLDLSKDDERKLNAQVTLYTQELNREKWDIHKMDPRVYDKFLNDYLNKINFNKVDQDTLYKCRDFLEIDLYHRRMEFFNKRLPPESNNNINLNNDNKNGAIPQQMNPFSSRKDYQNSNSIKPKFANPFGSSGGQTS